MKRVYERKVVRIKKITDVLFRKYNNKKTNFLGFSFLRIRFFETSFLL